MGPATQRNGEESPLLERNARPVRMFRWISPPALSPSAEKTIKHISNEICLPHSVQAPQGVLIEIGSGTGWHAISMAQNHPDKIVIGIERTTEKFQKFSRRVVNHSSRGIDLKNLFCVHADATRFIPQLWAAGLTSSPVLNSDGTVKSVARYRLETVYFLYPNPEPKAHSRRWIRMPFLTQIVEAMDFQSTIEFATNERFYAEEIECWAPARSLKIDTRRRVTRDSSFDFQPRTHFERKYFDRGDTLYFFTLKKETD